MGAMPMAESRFDDPLRLRELLGRAATLAGDHQVGSVVVGLAAREGDPVFPELIDFVESALRVDDAVFRLTRERAVLLLADADRARAEEILQRLVADFRARFAVVRLELAIGLYEVSPGRGELSVKAVLPALFQASPSAC